MNAALILASTSPTRRMLLEQAGVSFAAERPEIDERALEDSLAGADGAAVAAALAEAKARDVSRRFPSALVIGADQTLRRGRDALHKPASLAEARDQLIQLAGRTHHLHSAVALAQGGTTRWQHAETVAMTMRPLTDAEIDGYLTAAGASALASVGAYQVEGRGIQLFTRIDGDFFAVLGLPLLPLLARLRVEGVL